MDIYVLDELLRRDTVIDQYQSLIWTERRTAYGDFELVVRSDRGMRALLPVGTKLVIPPFSHRVMMVETIENTTDDEGTALLKVSGRSMEALLDDRVNQATTISTGTTVEYSEVEGTPGDIARYFFDEFCRNNLDVPEDNIPFLVTGSLFPPGSIAEPTDIILFRYEYASVYESIKKVCEVYNLGFRLVWNEVPNGAPSELYFDVYTGDDRTSLQSVNSTVIFSQGLDNLSNTTELTSTAQLKTVAYVFGQNGSRIVYADGYDDTVTGFERRVLVVSATDIDLVPGVDLDAALEQKGKEELSKYRVVIAFDGEIPQFGSYQYEVHYSLGDLVEQRNADGMATNMFVTEQIFISDQEGQRAYPTLAIDRLITPGSWYAWNASQVWDDADEYWEDA